MIFEERHFEYGDFISREYGLIFAHADTSTFLRIAGEVSSSYIFNKKGNTRYTIGNSYVDSPLSFEIDIVTDDFIALTRENRRVVEKALFNKDEFQRLYVDLADDCYGETYEFVNGEMKRLYLNCKLMNPEKIEDAHGRVVGYKCTVECDSGYLTQDEITVTYTVDPNEEPDEMYGDYIFDVFVDTDTNDYVYPTVTINVGSFPDGTTDDRKRVYIRNYSDRYGDELLGGRTAFDNLAGSEKIIVDSSKNYVSGGFYKNMILNKSFPRLVDGYNAIHVSPYISSVTVKWHNRRFL